MVSDETLTVGDLGRFQIKYLQFECVSDQELEEPKKVVDETIKKTVCAFQLLMARGRGCPDKKNERFDVSLTRKDELFNELVDMFQARNLSFPKADTTDKGSTLFRYCVTFCGIYCPREVTWQGGAIDLVQCIMK